MKKRDIFFNRGGDICVSMIFRLLQYIFSRLFSLIFNDLFILFWQLRFRINKSEKARKSKLKVFLLVYLKRGIFSKVRKKQQQQ